MAFVEDAAPFFADFGTNATWESASIRGLLDTPYAEAFGIMAGSAPRFICASADMPGVKTGDPITVAGQAFFVSSVEPDGRGLLSISLEKAD